MIRKRFCAYGFENFCAKVRIIPKKVINPQSLRILKLKKLKEIKQNLMTLLIFQFQ